ncbi:MAG: trypsin-like peptidase domain-containing protein [Bacillota bacterium]|nr:trypsin-like peptidase domain-containing protein [Bacillota bacterium]
MKRRFAFARGRMGRHMAKMLSTLLALLLVMGAAAEAQAAPARERTGFRSVLAGQSVNRKVRAPVVLAISPDHGASGQAVVIYGFGFSGATGVGFGGVPAQFQVVSDNVISASAPQGTGVVDVTVTTPAGMSRTVVTDRFTYVNQAALDRAVRATARLDISGGGSEVLCSGVLVSPTVVLTAKHCVDRLSDPQAASYKATFNPGAGSVTLPAKLLLTDGPHDLAALALGSAAPVNPAPVQASVPSAGDLVFDVGYPRGRANPAMKAGVVALPHIGQMPVSGAPVPDLTVTDIGVQSGDSGGPLVDGNGEVVGILSGGLMYRLHGLSIGASVFTWAPEVAQFAQKAEAQTGQATSGGS